MSELRKTVGHASIYAAGILLGRLIGFVMLPIYTSVLTTEDYGVLELLMMTTDVVSLIIGVGIVDGLFKFYFHYDTDEDRKQVVSTTFQLLLGIYGLAAVLAAFASGRVSALVFGDDRYSNAVKLVFGTLFFQICATFSLSYIRALQQPLHFVAVNVVRLVLQLSLNIYFIVILRLGVMGAVYSDFITSAAVGVFLAVHTLRGVGFRFNKAKAREILAFGAPFIVTNVGAFVLTFSDRFFIKYFWDVSQVGVYSLGYKIGFMLSFIVSRPLSGIWETQRFEVIKKPNGAGTLNAALFLHVFLLSTVGLGLSLFSRDLFRVMSAPAFWNASTIVPIVVLAYVVQGLTSFVSLGTYHKGRSVDIATSTFVSVLAILVLSFVLIPTFGGVGAALATLLAFVIRLGFVYHFSQKNFHIPYRLGRPAAVVLLATVLSGLKFALTWWTPFFENLAPSLALCVSLTVAFLVSVVAFRIVPDEYRNALIDYLLAKPRHQGWMTAWLGSLRVDARGRWGASPGRQDEVGAVSSQSRDGLGVIGVSGHGLPCKPEMSGLQDGERSRPTGR